MPKTYDPPPNLSQDKTNMNNDAFYRVVMNGTYAGQSVVNILYYRVGFGQLPGGMNFGGAQHLAQCFRASCWDGNLQTAASPFYTLNTIVCYPYNGDFDPLTQLPWTETVEETGGASGDSPGSMAAITCAFNLEGMTLGMNGFAPPRRGYISFGPYREGDVDNTGRLTVLGKSFYEQKLGCLALDLSALPWPVNYWPIRISTTVIADILTLRGFTDISGITIRNVASYRRSRKLEA